MSLESLQEKVCTHEKRLDKAEDRIGVLEKNDATNRQSIDNLVDQLKDLVVTMRWFIGIILVAILSFGASLLLKAIAQ